MLHIFLFILKIIGWILLAVLGLLVVLICIVFFVPLCYRAEGRCKGTFDSLYGKIRFSWLLHLVSGSAVYDEGKLMWSIRIAWKKLSGGMEEPWEEEHEPAKAAKHTEEEDLRALEELMEDREKQQESQKKENLEEEKNPVVIPAADEETAETATQQPDKREPEEKPAEKAATAGDRAVTKKIPDQKNVDSEKKILPPQKENDSDQGEEQEKESLFSRIEKKYRKSERWVQRIYKKIKYTFDKFCDTIKSLLEKKDKVLEFTEDEIHRSAFFAALKELRRLLRFLKPKRMEADVHFGFEDPGTTGKVLGLLSMLYPFLGKHTNIEPDFEQKILEGNIAITGKLRVLYVVIAGWNLIWNKNVRTTYRHIRKFEL